jgi:hypothetical protein
LTQPGEGSNTYGLLFLKDIDRMERWGLVPEERKADVEAIKKLLQE